MLKKLKKLWRGSRRARMRDAQIAELRAAVAALVQGQGAAHGKPVQGVEIDGMLLHAAKARVDLERIEALYGSVVARLAAVEHRLDRLAANMADPPTHRR